MERESLATMSDARVLEGVAAVSRRSNEITAELLAYLGEVDRRKLYRREATSSLFAFCVERLHMSESAAFKRIQAARTARRFPVVLELIGRGDIHLTAITLLAPHLTEENHGELLARARHRGKREIEKLVAAIAPRPDVASRLRALPVAPAANASPDEPVAAIAPSPAASPDEPVAAIAPSPAASPDEPVAAIASAAASPDEPAGAIAPSPGLAAGSPVDESNAGAARPARPQRPVQVAPLAPGRYELRVTVDQKTHDRLRQLQDLCSHRESGRDLAVLVEEAVELLFERTMTRRMGVTGKPRRGTPPAGRSRHIPASVRREVFARDGGQCAFVDGRGRRCSATAFIQFHHVDNWARGAEHSPERVELRCQAHNLYQAELDYGAELVAERRGRRSRAKEPRGRYVTRSAPVPVAPAEGARAGAHMPGVARGVPRGGCAAALTGRGGHVRSGSRAGVRPPRARGRGMEQERHGGRMRAARA